MPIVYEYANTIPEQNLKKYHLNSLTMSININLKLIFRNIFLNIIVLGIGPDDRDFLIYFFFPYLLLMVVTFHRFIERYYGWMLFTAALLILPYMDQFANERNSQCHHIELNQPAATCSPSLSNVSVISVGRFFFSSLFRKWIELSCDQSYSRNKNKSEVLDDKNSMK